MPFLSFIVPQDMYPSLLFESFHSLHSDNYLFSLISASRLYASDFDNAARCPYFCLSCVLPYVTKSNHMQFIIYSLLVPSTLLSTLPSTIRCTLSVGPSSHFAYPFSSYLCLYQIYCLVGRLCCVVCDDLPTSSH